MSLDAESRTRIRRSFEETNWDASSAYTRIARHIVNNNDVLDVFDHVKERNQNAAMLFAAVHYLVLSGAKHRLALFYETPDSRESSESIAAVFEDFCDDYDDQLRDLMNTRTLRTDEVNRCACLLPALMHIGRQAHRPLSFIDLGAGAGLDMLIDRYRYDYANGPVIGLPGAAVRLHSDLRTRIPKFDSSAPTIDYRIGVDVDPIDIYDPDEELWMRASIWVGEVAREQRLVAALELARKEWPNIERGSAVELLSRLVADAPNDAEICLVANNTLDTMSDPLRQALTNAITEAGSKRSLWWLTLEPVGVVAGLGDVSGSEGHNILGLQHFSPDTVIPQSRVLAVAERNGVWLDWRDEQTAAW